MAISKAFWSRKIGRYFGMHNPFSSALSKARDPYIKRRTLRRLSCSNDKVVQLAVANNISNRMNKIFDPHQIINSAGTDFLMEYAKIIDAKYDLLDISKYIDFEKEVIDEYLKDITNGNKKVYNEFLKLAKERIETDEFKHTVKYAFVHAALVNHPNARLMYKDSFDLFITDVCEYTDKDRKTAANSTLSIEFMARNYYWRMAGVDLLHSTIYTE